MNLQETIEDCIRWYPSLFDTRTSVLNHLFFVNGNGYDWIDGELVDIYEDENTRTEEDAVWANGWERYKEGMEEFIAEPVLANFFDNLKVFYKEKEEKYRKIRNEYKERASKDYTEEKFTRWYPVCKYAGIVTFPDDIKPDWAEGIKEVAQKILATTEEEWLEHGISYEDYWYKMVDAANHALTRLEELDV